MKKLVLLTLLTQLVISLSFAEKIFEGSSANEKFEGAVLVRYKDNVINPSFIRFGDDQGPLLANASEWIMSNFKLKTGFELIPIKTEEDGLGYTHVKFEQFFQGIKVEFASIVAHSKHGRVISISGASIAVSPESMHSLDETTSLQLALDFVKADIYKWEIAEEETFLKRRTGNNNATYFPAGKKVYLTEDVDFTSSTILACWKFDIYAQEPLYRAYVYVDAVSGAVVFENSRIKDLDTTCTAKTSYSGNRTIIADYVTNVNFRLRESTRGDGVETYDMLNGTSFGAAVDITNATNFWNDTLRIKYATDAHWGSEMVYDYYLNVHGRNSVDNLGLKLESYVHYGVNYANAFWNGSFMTYGDGGGGATAMTTLDISGHEITHGVDQYTSDLIYSKEPGALDESFADIFGNAVEIHYKPDPIKNWLVGEEIGYSFRSMSNPKSKSDPDTYGGSFWHPQTSPGDNYGVHTNSGVQNHWFYLLSVGGSGVNDKSDSYSVVGIGNPYADSIAYRSRAYYLSSNSDYEDARFFSIQAAFDIYGGCSQALASTTNAWYAVGVGDPYSTTVVSDFIASGSDLCNLPAVVQFTNQSNNNAINYLWDFGDGNTSNQKNPQHAYTARGTYSVKLTAIGNSMCGSDVEIKNNLINVDPPADAQVWPYTNCDGYPAIINVSAADKAFWYTDNVSTQPIFVGNPYVSPPLTKDTVFYAANGIETASQHIGPADNFIGGGAYYDFYKYLNFDVYGDLILQSVKVYSKDSSFRTIELRDNMGTVLQSKNVLVLQGEQTIPLNFSISPGIDYQLGVSFSTTAGFFYNVSGATYPYNLNGFLSIKSSSGNPPPGYYYFFYDWVVKGPDCVGKRFPIDVTVNFDPNCTPDLGFEENNQINNFILYPNPSNGIFNISFDLVKANKLDFRLIDSKGGVAAFENQIPFNSGSNKYAFEFGQLSKGIYLLQVDGNSMHETQRIVIQ